jgi:hypothetical protein
MTLVNLYTDTEVRIWYQLWLAREDLYPEPCAVGDIGEPPEWLGEMDLDILVSISSTYKEIEVGEGEEKHCFSYPWVQWGLEHGLAPRQPFQLRIFAPEYSVVGWECPEWDEEWTYEICDRAPLSNEVAAIRWSRFMKHARLSRETIVKQLKEARVQQLQDVKSMYLHYSWYWAHGSYYDEMCPPDGVSVTLQTRNEGKIKYHPWRGCSWCLGQGRDNDGKNEVALGKLIEEVTRKYPHLTPEVIRSLPVRW